VCVCVQAFTRY